MLDLLIEKLPSVEVEKLKAALASLDIPAIEAIQRERFAAKPWSGEPINGMDREQMLELGMPIPDGTHAFTIRDARSGRIVWFQTFDPSQRGHVPLTAERSEKLMHECIDRLVDVHVKSSVIAAVKLEVLNQENATHA